MEQLKARSFSDFIKKIETLGPLSDSIIFRGQAVRGNLLPSIAREDPETNTERKEQKALDQLKLMGASFPELAQQSLLDLMVVARHFGLKTRLLDWTSNPLAALWFACADTKSGDTFVYALVADDLQDKEVYKKDPFDPTKTRVFQPRLNNSRIVAQHGWFTLHRFSKKARAFIAIEKNRETTTHLTQILIPKGERGGMLESLEQFGISRRTLFPDLEGLCQYLNRKCRLG
jgi:hypothetical protein